MIQMERIPRTIREEQRDADREFLEKSRKLSPQFPSLEAAREKRRRRIENIAARVLGVLAVGFLLLAIFSPTLYRAGYAISSSVCFAALVGVGVAACNRDYDRRVASGEERGRPRHRPF